MADRFRHVWTATQIIDAWADPDVRHLRIMPGTYDISNTLVLDDLDSAGVSRGKTIEFVGDVTFQNCRIHTRTFNLTEWYASSGVNTATWGAPVAGVWNQVGGGAAWAATTGWEIFVRDCWYQRSASAGTTFTPTVLYKGNALATAEYVLCKPTKDINIRGRLRIEISSTPGYDTVRLLGLAHCDLSQWELHLYRAVDAAYGIQMAYRAEYCAACRLPQIHLDHIEFNTRSWAAGYDYPAQMFFCHSCWADSIRVGNVKQATALAVSWCGFAVQTCYRCRVRNMIVAGITRTGGGAADNCYGIAIFSCVDCLVEGNTTGLFSSAGGTASTFAAWNTNTTITTIAS